MKTKQLTKKILIDYVEQYDLCFQMFGMGACDEKELDHGLSTIRSATENKLINLGLERWEALSYMTDALLHKAELLNLYQGRALYE
jgi:hypothetical protein